MLMPGVERSVVHPALPDVAAWPPTVAATGSMPGTLGTSDGLGVTVFCPESPDEKL
jgi:hypothetical protein